MILPNVHQAQIARTKITDYLLSDVNPRGKAKADFFIGFGFNENRWEVFAEALKNHAASNELSLIVDTDYGLRYHVDGTLETPDGRNPQIRTVWQFDDGDSFPRLITAHPIRR